MIKRFDHEADMLRVGAGGDSLSSTLATRSEGGWELVSVLQLPAAEDEKTFEGGEARILFRLALFWKRPVTLEPEWLVPAAFKEAMEKTVTSVEALPHSLGPSEDRDEEDGWSRRFPMSFWVPVKELPASVFEVFLSAVFMHSEDDLEQLGILEHFRQKTVLQAKPR